jgi:hypothetical protein
MLVGLGIAEIKIVSRDLVPMARGCLFIVAGGKPLQIAVDSAAGHKEATRISGRPK